MRLYCLLSVVALSGCTTLGPTPSDDPKEIADLSQIIACKIKTAFNQLPKTERDNFKGWYATYQIKRTTTDISSAGANPLAWITPARVDKLVIGGNADVGRTGFRNGKAEFSIAVQGADLCEQQNAKLRVTPSDFKLEEWVAQVGRAKPTPDKFEYSVSVEVEAGVGVGPEFENGRGVASGNLSFRRKTNRTVDFAFAYRPDPQPLKVIIVSDRRQKAVDTIVPRSRDLKNKSPGARPEMPTPPIQRVPQSVIIQNRQSIMGLELDRLSPFGLEGR